MTPDERTLITGLFDRLRSADTNQKDLEAEQLIRSRVTEQPSAPYLMAQTVLVQEHALHNAQDRITQLERQLAEAQQHQGAPAQGGGGGFLSGLFGGGHKNNPAPPPSAPPPAPAAPLAPRQVNPSYAGSAAGAAGAMAPASAAGQYPPTVTMAPSSGGSFLRTAVAAAAGAAGGGLLLQGLEGMLGHNAGAFGGQALGGGLGAGGAGFAPGIGGGPTEVVNNYYEGGPGNAGGEGAPQSLGSLDDQGEGATQNLGSLDDPNAPQEFQSTANQDVVDTEPPVDSDDDAGNFDDAVDTGDDFGGGDGGDDSSYV